MKDNIEFNSELLNEKGLTRSDIIWFLLNILSFVVSMLVVLCSGKNLSGFSVVMIVIVWASVFFFKGVEIGRKI